ncbi:MAG: hypothetical protein PHZ00_06705 [Candidatus Peribacteraceae bacterium]|nr:hypothetical protein [Candidatus Peribacteraceae bacterium]
MAYDFNSPTGQVCLIARQERSLDLVLARESYSLRQLLVAAAMEAGRTEVIAGHSSEIHQRLVGLVKEIEDRM